MEVYKLGNVINKKNIEIQFILHHLNRESDELKCSLKRRKEIGIEENDTHYQEEDTTELFIDWNSSEFDAAVANLIKKNGALIEDVRNIKIEQEVQLVFLCEVID